MSIEWKIFKPEIRSIFIKMMLIVVFSPLLAALVFSAGHELFEAQFLEAVKNGHLDKPPPSRKIR